jgi:hypothetical protein
MSEPNYMSRRAASGELNLPHGKVANPKFRPRSARQTSREPDVALQWPWRTKCRKPAPANLCSRRYGELLSTLHRILLAVYPVLVLICSLSSLLAPAFPPYSSSSTLKLFAVLALSIVRFTPAPPANERMSNIHRFTTTPKSAVRSHGLLPYRCTLTPAGNSSHLFRTRREPGIGLQEHGHGPSVSHRIVAHVLTFAPCFR